ncbi:tubby C-terminal-like domain-containing protein [Paraphysoderma sedebokerense]|nr:tubby C-terminal-like domain-containing protein [Paraphysoderma sedebokerense]
MNVNAKYLKDLIKRWERQFEIDHGRRPQKEDVYANSDISHLYKLYNRLKSSEKKSESGTLESPSRDTLTPDGAIPAVNDEMGKEKVGGDVEAESGRVESRSKIAPLPDDIVAAVNGEVGKENADGDLEPEFDDKLGGGKVVDQDIVNQDTKSANGGAKGEMKVASNSRAAATLKIEATKKYNQARKRRGVVGQIFQSESQPTQTSSVPINIDVLSLGSSQVSQEQEQQNPTSTVSSSTPSKPATEIPDDVDHQIHAPVIIEPERTDTIRVDSKNDVFDQKANDDRDQLNELNDFRRDETVVIDTTKAEEVYTIIHDEEEIVDGVIQDDTIETLDDNLNEELASDANPLEQIQPNSLLRSIISRSKSSLTSQPLFTIQNEQSGTTMFTARRFIKMNMKPVFYIAVGGVMEHGRTEDAGWKLKGNYQGSEFKLIELSTGKLIAFIRYSSNAIPRQIFVAAAVKSGDQINPTVLTKLTEHNMRNQMARLTEELGNSGQSIVLMKNKLPKYNPALKTYCLNFGGRVTVPSVKNFQLIVDHPSSSDSKVHLQFGRIAKDSFTLDARNPLTPLIGFAVCLSTFNAIEKV